jgi:quercetin dioxygenase-like cupin family protein
MRETTNHQSPNRTSMSRLLAVFSVLTLLLLTIVPGVSAQEATPEASPEASPAAAAPAGAVISPLFSFDFEQLPEAPVTVRLLRITLEPGASVPEHTHPGPEFGLVESGTLSVVPTGDAQVSVGGDPVETVSDPIELNAGDWVLYPAEVGMAFSNQTEEPVTILSAVMQPVGDGAPASIAYADESLNTDTEARQTAYVGVSFVVLGDGLLRNLPEGPATMTVSQVSLEGGAAFPANANPVLVSHIDGNLSFSVDGGDVQVTRSANQSLSPSSPIGEEYTLETGDAAFFPSGVAEASREDQPEPVNYYTLEIIAGGAESDPATISFIDPVEVPTPEPDATPSDGTTGDDTGGLAAGTVVTTNTDTVNVRTEPSVTADVVEQVAEGVDMTIVSGPEEADDYTWYEVEITDSGQTGWVADEFFDAEGAAEEEATEEPVDGTPAAEGETPTFAEGDAVVVTEDGVRFRDSASVDGEVIGSLDADTPLTIVSGPEEADDYIWYEVETEDGESGFVVADFLEAGE